MLKRKEDIEQKHASSLSPVRRKKKPKKFSKNSSKNSSILRNTSDKKLPPITLKNIQGDSFERP